MRILFVSSYFLPYVSGLTIHAKRLAEGLSQKKHRVELVTNAHLSGLSKSETVNGVLIRRVSPWFRLSRGFVSPALFFLFLKELSKNDIVVLHLPMPEAFIFSPMAKIFRKKVFLIYHANLNLPSWRISSKIIEKIVLINHSFAAIFADKIVAYSDNYANFASFLKKFKSKVVTIFPPVTVNPPNLKSAIKLRKENNLVDNKVIGFAGRFAEEKGGDILLESLEYLVKKYPNIKIIFAGEKNVAYENFYQRKKNLIDQYAKSVIFLGLISPEKMPEFYKICDILALPSRAECFGMVQVESMLCGTPVVAFDIPGGKVPIQETGMGVLAREISSKSLAEAIIKVLSNIEKYKVTPEMVKRHFNYQETIDDFEKLFVS